MDVHAELMVSGRTLTLADPSCDTFDAAGDFDRLLPVSGKTFPVFARVDLYGTATVASGDLLALVPEVALLRKQGKPGSERRGLLRLQALALAGLGNPDAVIRFSGHWYADRRTAGIISLSLSHRPGASAIGGPSVRRVGLPV